MTQPAYIFARLTVKDFGDYLPTYGAGFMELLPKYEGELLSATTDAKVVEGESDGNWTVLVKFPSRARAEEFYYSDDYAPLIELRTKTLGTTGSLILFDHLPAAQ